MMTVMIVDSLAAIMVVMIIVSMAVTMFESKGVMIIDSVESMAERGL